MQMVSQVRGSWPRRRRRGVVGRVRIAGCELVHERGLLGRLGRGGSSGNLGRGAPNCSENDPARRTWMWGSARTSALAEVPLDALGVVSPVHVPGSFDGFLEGVERLEGGDGDRHVDHRFGIKAGHSGRPDVVDADSDVADRGPTWCHPGAAAPSGSALGRSSRPPVFRRGRFRALHRGRLLLGADRPRSRR
jgi:hypothetical protein